MNEDADAVAHKASAPSGAKEALNTLVATRSVGCWWEVALTAATFLKATDPQLILAAAPANPAVQVPVTGS
jgi:hypothetical protein